MKRVATYKDLKSISTEENNENYILANAYDQAIIMSPSKEDQESFFDGNRILVRDKVAQKLAQVNREIQELYSNYTLLIDYGYRDINVQNRYYDKEYLEIKKQNPKVQDEEVLQEMTHRHIAVPEVAGHPTGGAVDLTVFDLKKKQEINMGGAIHDFSSNKLATFSDGLTEEQELSRKILLNAMMKQEFAPFYEEWWHFSYGDREWAFFYDKDHAIYEQKPILKRKG